MRALNPLLLLVHNLPHASRTAQGRACRRSRFVLSSSGIKAGDSAMADDFKYAGAQRCTASRSDQRWSPRHAFTI